MYDSLNKEPAGALLFMFETPSHLLNPKWPMVSGERSDPGLLDPPINITKYVFVPVSRREPEPVF